MKRSFVALTLSAILIGSLVSSSHAQVGRGKFGFGLSLVGNTLQSDWKTNDIGFGAAADLSYGLGNNWGLISKVGLNSFSGKNTTNQNVLSTVLYGNIGISYDLLPDKPLNPFLFGRVGLAFYSPRIDNGDALTSGKYQMWDMSFGGGLGVDYYVSESWSLIVTAEAGMLTNDQIDGYKAGGANDISAQISVGFRYYLFDRSTVQKIVDLVRR